MGRLSPIVIRQTRHSNPFGTAADGTAACHSPMKHGGKYGKL